MKQYLSVSANPIITPVMTKDNSALSGLSVGAEVIVIVTEPAYSLVEGEDSSKVTMVKTPKVDGLRFFADVQDMRDLADALYEIADEIERKVETATDRVEDRKEDPPAPAPSAEAHIPGPEQFG